MTTISHTKCTVHVQLLPGVKNNLIFAQSLNRSLTDLCSEGVKNSGLSAARYFSRSTRPETDGELRYPSYLPVKAYFFPTVPTTLIVVIFEPKSVEGGLREHHS